MRTSTTMFQWTAVSTVVCIMWFYVVPSLGLYCDPLKNLYYMPQIQECLPCERCLIGEEPIPIQDWDIIIPHKQGPTECRKCRKCKVGTYSPHRSLKCTKCTDCAVLGKVEQSACTHTADTVCTDINTKPTTTPMLPAMPKREDEEVSKQRILARSEIPDKPKQADHTVPYIALGVSVAIAIIVLLVLIASYSIRMAKAKRRREGTSADYHSLSTADPNSTSQSSEDTMITTESKAKIEIIAETSPKKNVEKTADGSWATWCRKRQTRKEISQERLPLLKERRGVVTCSRRRRYTFPSADSCLHDNPMMREDFLNEIKTSEKSETETNSTAEGQVSSLSSAKDVTSSSKPTSFIRQCSYPLGKSDKVSSSVETDQLILAKVVELVRTQNTTNQYDIGCIGHDNPSAKELETDAAEPEMDPFSERNIQADLKHRILSDENIRKFSMMIIKDDIYKDVARELGLNEHDLHEVHTDYDKVKEKAYQAMYKVKEKRAKVSVKDIVDALEQLNHRNIRDEFLLLMTIKSR